MAPPPPATYALMRRRAELAAQIARHSRALEKAQRRFAHVEAALAILAPKPPKPKRQTLADLPVLPERYRSGRQVFRAGELGQLVRAAIRDGAVDLGAITTYVMRAIDIDPDNAVLARDIRRRARYALRDQTRQGRLIREGNRWSIPN